jgi:hypothetical protein
MKGIVERAGALDIRAYEIASIECLTRELVPATRALLDEARALLAALSRTSGTNELAEAPSDDGPDPIRTSYLPFERAIDVTVESKLGSIDAVDEIVFIAELELRQRAERLERVRPAQGPAVLLGECDSSLRRIKKALSAVDAAIAEVTAVPRVLDFTPELETSLASRRAYAKFRSRIMKGGEPTPETLRARLRLAGTQIAVLVGWDVYPDLRVRDRLLLRELQERVLAWLRGEHEDASSAGTRLFQDLAACVEMFSLVNRRQELVEHDAAVVRRLVEKVEAGVEHLA